MKVMARLPTFLLAAAAASACTFSGGDDPSPERVASVALASHDPVIDVGQWFGCASKSDGTLYCWGDNSNSQLGDGTSITRTSPTLINGISEVVDVSVGWFHSCAATETGSVYCWGVNNYGKLGDGTLTKRTTPNLVPNLGNVVQVVAGYNHTCSLSSSGVVMCWGDNGYGQIGDNTTTMRTTPTTVSSILSDAVSISVGTNLSCAVTSGGSVYCWGQNQLGGLGDGTMINRDVPVQVPGISTAVAVTSGTVHTCALLSDGTVKCWGGGAQGQLGNGTNTGIQLTPVSVSGISTAVRISAGSFNTCAALADGTAKCWGYNGYGNLGDGTQTQRNSPVTVSGLADAVSVTEGVNSACALRVGGGAKCWGSATMGQLGYGATALMKTTPVNVLNLP